MKELALDAQKGRWFAAEPVDLSDRRLWIAAAAILLFSLAQRLYFYSGFYGSDEVTYLAAAVRALNGDLSPTTYIGAIRYGFQLPVTGLMFVFGQSEAVANLWTLICSLAEVVSLVLIGNFIVGFRAAVLGGLLLGTLPLHVHYAGRLMADPPLAFFMTATFLLFWLGQRQNRSTCFFAAGLAAGMVLWTKESTTVFLATFLAYPVVFRCWNWRWGWMVLGFALMLGANLLFFNAISGDPLYAFRIAGGSVSAYTGDDVRFASVIDSPFYYLQYLLLKPYHTWLLGFLAVAGLAVFVRGRYRRTPDATSASYVVWWCFGMLILFSALPVSFAPIKLITKQVNYMLMLMAPLALLGGVALAGLQRRTLVPALGLIVVPAAILSAMEKNVVEIFTANSQATVGFAKAHPGVTVHGAIGAQRAAVFDALVDPRGEHVRIADMNGPIEAVGREGGAYVVVDTETAAWGYKKAWRPESIPRCWVSDGVLDARPDLALPAVFAGFRRVAQSMPGSLGGKVVQHIDALTVQKPALLFRVPAGGCGGQ